jgi:hypothetical protein
MLLRGGMLLTALVCFFVASIAQAVDPGWAGIPVFFWIGIVASVLLCVGIVLAVLDARGHRPIIARHAHA